MAIRHDWEAQKESRMTEEMKKSSFVEEMNESYQSFTKTEKKIADFVSKNSAKVLFMSITDLAEACHVADASVHRFCRTLGLKGYQEFKMKISLGMTVESQGARRGDNMQLKVDSLQYSMENILQSQISALKETSILLNQGQVEKTIIMMEEAQHIYFFGIGDSLLTAKEARNKFLRITKKVSCVDDPHMQAMTTAMLNSTDLIIFISYSGSTKDNVYVAQIAKNVGAKITAITRFEKSPLSAYANTLLLCGSNEGPLEGGSMSAKISQLYIIDILFQEYYRRNLGLSAENNKKTSRAVVDKLF